MSKFIEINNTFVNLENIKVICKSESLVKDRFSIDIDNYSYDFETEEERDKAYETIRKYINPGQLPK